MTSSRARRAGAAVPLWGVLALVGACSAFDPLAQSGLTVLLVPRDTALYVGGRLQVRGMMVNSFGDVYPSGHFRFKGLDSSATVASDGLVTGVSYGRARVVAYREHLADTGWVSVVPSGAFAASAGYDTVTIRVVNADGSEMRVIPTGSAYFARKSAWLAGGEGLVYEAIVQGAIRLVVNDLAGHTRTLVPGGQDPRSSRDGSWIYYRISGAGEEIWRVRPDGTGAERIRAALNAWTGAADPDPSPDGSQLVYWAGYGGQSVLTVRHLASGVERTLGVPGLTPRWAPDGTRIAFWSGAILGHPLASGAIFLVNADGTGLVQVSDSARDYRPGGLDWSPDGQWIVATTGTSLDLIHVATGRTLPLGYAAGYSQPAWRPSAALARLARAGNLCCGAGGRGTAAVRWGERNVRK